MYSGKVVSIHIASAASAHTQSLNAVQAIPGKGLKGDRYFQENGTYSDRPGPDREITLIEIEAIEAIEHESQIKLNPGDARRNLVTRSVALNHLVGKEFSVGDVRLRGIRLCEPCSHLASLTQPDVLPALIHRGGLRAQILSQGIIHVGDNIKE